ncbi:MAG: hypothetical protein JXA60_00115 [Candidatus Coatesbacteria bacterium]|nr:hypothetical protein [Candidatus Coatesbacteria bacterium]
MDKEKIYKLIIPVIAIAETLALIILVTYMLWPEPPPDHEKERKEVEDKLKEAIPIVLSNMFVSSEKIEVIKGNEAKEFNLPYFSEYMENYISVSVIIKGDYKIGFSEQSFRQLNVKKDKDRYFATVNLYRPALISKKADLLMFDPTNGWYNKFHDANKMENIEQELREHIFKRLDLEKERNDVQKKAKEALFALGISISCHIDVVWDEISKEEEQKLVPAATQIDSTKSIKAEKKPPMPKDKKKRTPQPPAKKEAKPDPKTAVKVLLKKDAPKPEKIASPDKNP